MFKYPCLVFAGTTPVLAQVWLIGNSLHSPYRTTQSLLDRHPNFVQFFPPSINREQTLRELNATFWQSSINSMPILSTLSFPRFLLNNNQDITTASKLLVYFMMDIVVSCWLVLHYWILPVILHYRILLMEQAEKLNNLPKPTQLRNVKAKSQKKAIWVQNQHSFTIWFLHLGCNNKNILGIFLSALA